MVSLCLCHDYISWFLGPIRAIEVLKSCTVNDTLEVDSCVQVFLGEISEVKPCLLVPFCSRGAILRDAVGSLEELG